MNAHYRCLFDLVGLQADGIALAWQVGIARGSPTRRGLPAIIDGSGRKARDRIEHFLRAAIDNDNTRRAYGRALGSFFAFLEDGGREPVQDIGPLDVRDYLDAAKANGLSTATLKHMAAIRMLFDHLVTGAVSVKPRARSSARARPPC